MLNSTGGRVLGFSPNQRIDRSVIKTGSITLVDKSNKVSHQLHP